MDKKKFGGGAKKMKFKEFRNWCNERACDGCWSMRTAMICINVIETIQKAHFWKREKIWKKEHEYVMVNYVVDPINKKITEVQKK